MRDTSFGGLSAGIDAMPNGATLHENNGMVPILAGDGRRQAKDVPRLRSTRDHFETACRQMMALVDHKVTIIPYQVGHFAVT